MTVFILFKKIYFQKTDGYNFLTDNKLEDIIVHLSENENDFEAENSESDFDIRSLPIILSENII